ncbi:gasdermin-A3-like isoform X1 [Zonotrichia leucophrys gambelii]|uniref:gasdermin-A3-like isoform X1 n=1 Tax=Zonotrichia leucophrys gambelii TaxID=257770 RepID=UPI003140C0FC
MFKKVTKFIVNQMDPCKELDPVESIVHNEHFRPLCLLIKKKKSNRIFHRAPYYQRTGFTLDDVLLPGEDGTSTESLHQESSQFTLTKVSADQVDGGLSIAFDPASVELKGGASLSKGFSVKPQKKSISQQYLEALKRERKINMDHSFIRQLQRTGIRLYVVTETLEASEEAVYEESTKADGGFMAKFYATLSAKGTRESNQGIVIPKGCTLAFRTIPLHIRDGAWDLGYISIEDYGLPVSQGGSVGKLGVMGGEVEIRCHIFSELSPDLLLIILNTIKAVMRDENLLQELSQKVSEAFLTDTIYKYRYIHTTPPQQPLPSNPDILFPCSPQMEEVLEENYGYELKTESPDLKELFSTLQQSPRHRLLQLAEGITYVLDALQELTEDQLLLLLESLERKIVSQQLNLVVHLLKPNLLSENLWPYFVDPGLLSFPRKEDQMLTIALVELSGVQLQENGSAIPRNKPFEAVAALLVALYTLHLLSSSK